MLAETCQVFGHEPWTCSLEMGRLVPCGFTQPKDEGVSFAGISESLMLQPPPWAWHPHSPPPTHLRGVGGGGGWWPVQGHEDSTSGGKRLVVMPAWASTGR